MISSLSILNFLSHKETSLELSPGVNIIIGPTDSGKSAIVKALKWVITNRPMGDGMRSSWGGVTFVEIVVDGEVDIGRLKDEKGNRYTRGAQEFNALKGEVPTEVAQALNLSDINLQTQFDSHFLLSNSSGEVAQYFNKVAHLDKIDAGLQNINKWTREIQKKIEYTQGALDGNQERLKNYDVLDSIESRLISLEQKDVRRERLLVDRLSLIKTLNNIEEIDQKLEEIEFLGELDTTVESVLALYNKKKKVEQDHLNLIKVLDDIQELERTLERMEFLQNLEGAIGTLLGLYNKKKAALQNMTAVQISVNNIEGVNYELAQLNMWLIDNEEVFHKALGKGSICPLCGSIIK